MCPFIMVSKSGKQSEYESYDTPVSHAAQTRVLKSRGLPWTLTRFNKIATQGAPQMAVDKEPNSLSRVYSYYSKFNLCFFYV